MSKPNSKPMYVLPTSFCVFPGIFKASFVSEALNGLVYVKPSEWRWKVVNERRGRVCKFEINVYDDDAKGVYIVEMSGVMGDDMLSRDLFNMIRSRVTGEPMHRSLDPIPLPADIDVPELTDDDADDAIMPLLEMLKDASVYNQTMALEVLCEMSYEADVQSHMLRTGCYDAVARYMSGDNIKHKILAHKIQVNRYMYEFAM